MQRESANYRLGSASQVITSTGVTNAQAIVFTTPPPALNTPGSTFTVAAQGGASGKPVTFSIDAASTSGACSVSGATISFAAAGTCILNANQAGSDDGAYSAAPQVQRAMTVTAGTQSITFAKPADAPFSPGATVALTATATSGLAVTFASQTPSTCSVAGSTATLLAIGACTIKASQAGNSIYAAAADVTQTFNVGGAPGLTLAVSASPSSLTAIGQTVTFTYTVSNTGNVAVASLAVTDTRAGGIACLATTLAGGAKTTCTGSTVSTATDVAARGIASSAVAKATFNATTVSSATVATSVAVSVAAVQAATTKAVQTMLSQRGNLIVSNGPDTGRAHARLGGGTLGGNGDAGAGGAGFASTAPPMSARPRSGFGAMTGGASAMLGYSGGGMGSGSISEPGGIGGLDAFLGGRSAASPDALARFDRGPGFQSESAGATGIFGQGFGPGFQMQRDYPDAAADHGRPAVSAFRFTGQAEDGMGRFAFSTSLGQLRAAVEAQDQAKRASVAALAAGAPATGLGAS